MSSEDFVSHEALLGSTCTFRAYVIFGFEEFIFEFVKFLGDDHPRSRSVSAANLRAGRVFAVIGIGVVIDREVDPGDRFGQWCYRDQHCLGMGAEGEVD